MEGLQHGEKIVDSVLLKYVCQPCPECKAKLEAAEEMLAALKRALPWLGKMIADGHHLECVRPSDAEKTLALMQAIIAKAEGRE